MTTSAEKTKLTVELMRRGAVLMKEPCQVCNGVQVRYRGKTYCTSHEDLAQALQVKEVSFPEVAEGLRNLMLSKLRESMAALEAEKDPERLDQLVSLMTKYVELLKKLEAPQRT